MEQKTEIEKHFYDTGQHATCDECGRQLTYGYAVGQGAPVGRGWPGLGAAKPRLLWGLEGASL